MYMILPCWFKVNIGQLGTGPNEKFTSIRHRLEMFQCLKISQKHLRFLESGLVFFLKPYSSRMSQMSSPYSPHTHFRDENAKAQRN